MTRESAIEKAVCEAARRAGWLTYKFVSPTQRGVPDRLFIRDGDFVFIEFKAPGKRPSKLQDMQIAKLRKAGCEVHVVDNVENGKGVLGLC